MSVKMNRTKDWQKVPLPETKSFVDYLPKYVGKWEMGKGNKFYFFTLKKPNWFHRKMTHLILGWVWHD
tara:strand:+ start:518 stop:721 length:204 start_codon:yes stop_codon:yes gene_type:complete